MNYQQTLDYLYHNLPVFQNEGKKALNFKLDNIRLLCSKIGNPQEKLKFIHVGGTNGKGSTSHILSAILQQHDYKVGLYTSPHLRSFTERIKINGKEISQQEIIDFVQNIQLYIQEIKPSFFEVTVAMAFWYFQKQSVDIAIIEVGMGGRLDSTNIISPLLSVITNISLDHQQYLGDTISKIAFEKGGIIKQDTPVVIGEIQKQSFPVFETIAEEKNADLKFELDNNKLLEYLLTDSYQDKNIETALKAIEVLEDLGFDLDQDIVISSIQDFKNIAKLTGRWHQLNDAPKIICDTGHNVAGVKEVVKLLNKEEFQQLHIVIGMVEEKDVDTVLQLLPKSAIYYFCKADNFRSLDEKRLQSIAEKYQLIGKTFSTVSEALFSAKNKATPQDFIFIGGSTFVVAEVL